MKKAIEAEAAWQYKSSTGLCSFYGHVDFHGPYVLGQWFCLDAVTGARIWAKNFGRPDTIEGIDEGVIVASEMVLGGMWTAAKGCYGISLASGELLWTSHGDGFWNGLWSALDRIPDFTNEFRDTAVAVQDGKVYCESGRTLNIRDGQRISYDRSLAASIQEECADTSEAHRLYSGETVILNKMDGLRLTIVKSDAPYDLQLQATTTDGTVGWIYRLSDDGFFTEGNYYTWRYHYPLVYIIAQDARPYVPIKEKEPGYVRRNETRSRLLVLDVREGQIVQEVHLGDKATTIEHRIEAIGDLGLLISKNQTLQLFRFAKDT